MIRLDKFLTDHGFGTRSQVKELLKKGQVTVDGVVCKKPETKIDQTTQKVVCQGSKIAYEEFAFYVLNKPAGMITAATDPKQSTVMDLFAQEPRTDLFPVGRLDKDTVGLLLITNHGTLCHKMLAPKSHVDKTYLVHLAKELSEAERIQVEQGVDIGEKELTKPAKCKKIDGKCVELTIVEGKFHQVKRMFEAVDNEVIYLKRLTFGPLKLEDTLAEGTYRKCTPEEVSALMALMS